MIEVESYDEDEMISIMLYCEMMSNNIDTGDNIFDEIDDIEDLDTIDIENLYDNDVNHNNIQLWQSNNNINETTSHSSRACDVDNDIQDTDDNVNNDMEDDELDDNESDDSSDECPRSGTMRMNKETLLERNRTLHQKLKSKIMKYKKIKKENRECLINQLVYKQTKARDEKDRTNMIKKYENLKNENLKLDKQNSNLRIENKDLKNKMSEWKEEKNLQLKYAQLENKNDYYKRTCSYLLSKISRLEESDIKLKQRRMDLSVQHDNKVQIKYMENKLRNDRCRDSRRALGSAINPNITSFGSSFGRHMKLPFSTLSKPANTNSSNSVTHIKTVKNDSTPMQDYIDYIDGIGDGEFFQPVSNDDIPSVISKNSAQDISTVGDFYTKTSKSKRELESSSSSNKKKSSINRSEVSLLLSDDDDSLDEKLESYKDNMGLI